MFTLLQLDDLSDSSGTAQASEIVIGLFHPYREKIANVDGYSIKILQDKVRILQILKHRFGKSDVNKCINFHGEIGWYNELPPANEIIDYAPYINLIDKVTIPDQEEVKETFSFAI